MSYVTQPWLRGVDGTSCVLTPYVQDANGVLQPSAAANITAVLDQYVPEYRTEVSQIRAVNDPNLNDVVVASGFGCRVRAVTVRNGLNAASAFLGVASHIGVTARVGAETHVGIFTLTGGQPAAVEGPEKNTCELVLGPVSIYGQKNLVITA